MGMGDFVTESADLNSAESTVDSIVESTVESTVADEAVLLRLRPVGDHEAAGSSQDLLPQPDFGHLLRLLRTRQGLTQRDLAGPGLSVSYLSLLESGQRQPSRRTVTAVAGRLGVDPLMFHLPRRESPAGPNARWQADAARIIEGVGEEMDGNSEDAELALRAVIEDEGTSPELILQAQCHLADLMHSTGRPEASARLLRKLLADPRVRGYPCFELYLLVRLARDEHTMGRLQECVILTRQARHLVEKAGEQGTANHIRALVYLVGALSESGRLPEAAHAVEELAELAERSPSVQLRALSHSALAHALLRAGEIVRGAEHQRRALEALRPQDNLLLWGRLRKAAATVALEVMQDQDPAPGRGDGGHAMDLLAVQVLLQDADRALSLVGTERDRAELEMARALLAFLLDDPEGALETALRAREVLIDPAVWDGARCMEILARAEYALGRVDEAVESYRAAGALFEQAGAYHRGLAALRASNGLLIEQRGEREADRRIP